ncbi:hypothetical protein T02_11051 [Trichinella nativa]|uniref:Reverse transcriptase domain-containing protein n=1 Tax=Trichinella nativa TaxID=6335 RepID=A0A0V1LNW3_9BILA|nr:hypothetical protein T02_11051 [Trichinella nativa]
MQVVNHHLREKRDCFGTVVDDIIAGMYLDDLVVSCDSIEEARDFAHRSSELLASWGFHLAKWASDAPEALVDRPTEEISRDRYSCLWKTHNLESTGVMMSCDLIKEATGMAIVDINELQNNIRKVFSSGRNPPTKSRGVREFFVKKMVNPRVARFKRFQRLFRSNRRKLTSSTEPPLINSVAALMRLQIIYKNSSLGQAWNLILIPR